MHNRLSAGRLGPALTTLALSGAVLTGTATASTASTASAAAVDSPRAASAGLPVARAGFGSTAAIDGSGLKVVANAATNNLVLAQRGGRFLVTDSNPVKAGSGCRVVAVPGPRSGVICRIVRTPNGQIRSVTILTGEGDDSFRNSSSAPVRADGQGGDDNLVGGPAGDRLDDDQGRNILDGRGGPDSLSTNFGSDPLPDVLRGGDGDDDLRAGDTDDVLEGGNGDDTMRGGLGADDFVGGAGEADAVVYLDNDHEQRVIASIDGTANDGLTDEGDNVRTDVEELFGGHASDILTGSPGDDRISGNLGDDVLIGRRGADQIRGGPGNDRMASNELFGVPVADGSIDVLNGETGDADSCRIPFTVVEDDATISCELINED